METGGSDHGLPFLRFRAVFFKQLITPSRAWTTDCRRTDSRPPLNRHVSVSTALPCAQAKHTVPTGFSLLPPPGPAIPVMATAMAPLLRPRAPRAISRAVCSLTAPWAFKVFRETFRSSCLASFEYVTKPRSNHAEEPATDVTACAAQPPVQDSAVTGRRRLFFRTPPRRAARFF